MYSSSYSRAKLGLDAREPLHRSRGKSCGYYVKVVFFFSSLIQSLIIVSLVLFLVYGQPEKSAEEKRVQELEQSFNRLSEVNIQLRKDKADLGAQLGAKAVEKAAVQKELETVKAAANTTEFELKKKHSDCEKQQTMLRVMGRTTPVQPPVFNYASSELKMLQTLNTQQKAMINLIEANFTQTVQYLSQERDTAIRDRDMQHKNAIDQRKENTLLKDQLNVYSKKCKEDFVKPLDGIKEVTSAFLNKINNLFPHQLTFHLSCPSQAEQMEKIRNNCTNLSSDVETKFQIYLDRVGDKVAEIQTLSSRMQVVNKNLDLALKTCQTLQAEKTTEAKTQMDMKQKEHDLQMERLLNEQNRLRNQRKLQDENLALKESELKTAKDMLATCKPGPKTGVAPPQLQNKQTIPNWPSQGKR